MDHIDTVWLVDCIYAGRNDKGQSEPVRITIQEPERESVVIKIEGKVAGLLVTELHRAWQELAAALGERKLRVDLCGVTHVDGTGQNLLAEIHAKTGAEFVADTPLTKYFAEQAQVGDSTKI